MSTTANGRAPALPQALDQQLPATPAIAGAQSRETALILGAYTMANNYPRDEAACVARLLETCRSKRFAGTPKDPGGPVYSFRRGGATIAGIGIRLAREIALAWKHIESGAEILNMGHEECHVRGYAIDYQHGVRAVREGRFKLLVQRRIDDATRWVRPDERDLRELVAKQCSLVERSAILAIIPDHVKNAAFDEVRKTQVSNLPKNLHEARAATMDQLQQIGVSLERVEARLGHSFDELGRDGVIEIWHAVEAIRAGESSVDDEFPRVGEPPKAKATPKAAPPTTLDELAARGAGKADAAAEPPDDSPPWDEGPAPAPAAKAAPKAQAEPAPEAAPAPAPDPKAGGDAADRAERHDLEERIRRVLVTQSRVKAQAAAITRNRMKTAGAERVGALSLPALRALAAELDALNAGDAR